MIIGESFQGGIVAYINTTGVTDVFGIAPGGGFVVSELLGSDDWYNGSFTLVNSPSDVNGKTNTDAIISAYGVGVYAASICDNYSNEDYSDWYLPARTEMQQIYDNRILIGGLGTSRYWTSTENAPNSAVLKDFADGADKNFSKSTSSGILAIRKITPDIIKSTYTPPRISARPRLNNRDLAMYECGDGGDLIFKDKDLEVTSPLYNQPYLARFGGDNDYWGNELFYPNQPNKQFTGSLERLLNKVAINTAGRSQILRAAENDTAYLKSIATIVTTVSIIGVDKIRINDIFTQPDGVISSVWDTAKGEVIEQRFISRTGNAYIIDPDGGFLVDENGDKIIAL